MTMTIGGRVKISGRSGEVDGEVLEVRAVDDLPDLPGFRFRSGAVREMLRTSCRRVAWLGYHYDADNFLVFVALEDFAGEWWDMQGNCISLVEVR